MSVFLVSFGDKYMTVGGAIAFFVLFFAALAVAAVLFFGLRAVKLI